MQIRCNFPDISYLSETQKNNFQFLNKDQETPLFHVWLFGADLTMCKLNQRPIIFVMQSNIASKHATSMARYTMVVNKR